MKLFFRISMLALLLGFTQINSQAQPDPPGGGHGLNGDQVPGGGAPIGKGVFILLGLSTIYGITKIYQLKHNTYS